MIVVQFDEEWHENFRISQVIFSCLCSELREHIKYQDTRLQCSESVDKRVAITLWHLATNSDYREDWAYVQDLHEVCHAIIQV